MNSKGELSQGKGEEKDEEEEIDIGYLNLNPKMLLQVATYCLCSTFKGSIYITQKCIIHELTVR